MRPTEALTLRAGWTADVVSGASVAVKAGPTYQALHRGADVVTSASVHDFRNSARGGFTLREDVVSFTAGYTYSTENDYRSNAFNVSARTKPLERDTQLEIYYAHNFDELRNRVQTAGEEPTGFRALEDSSGCFTSDPIRTTNAISIDTLQGTWSQAWTPAFVTQVVYDAQIKDGFQSNPYRSVIIADGQRAQEHEPGDRTREFITLKANVYLPPLRAALRLSLRGYRDTWGVESETGEVEFEKYLGESFRVLLRGRGYNQTGALFWSDDYTGGNPPLGPKGQYWSGDRALSPFWSWLGGVRGIYTVTPSRGRLLGLMTRLKVGVSFDMQGFTYSQFTLGGVPVGNAYAYLGGLSLAGLLVIDGPGCLLSRPEDSTMKKGDRYGLHRVIEPHGVLPQAAHKIDNTMDIYDNEVLLDVETLNIDSASFTQIENQAGGDKKKIADIMLAIVAERGKHQNPVTGSGGMFIGRVRQVGPALEGKVDLRPGDPVASLVSLSLTPLRIDRIRDIRPDIDQVDIDGQAILFESGIWAKLPSDISPTLALSVLDVAGAVPQVARLVQPSDTVLVVGAGGKSGMLCMHEARKRAGCTGTIIGLTFSERSTARARGLGLADVIFAADATKPVEVLTQVERLTNGRLCDVVINCANNPNTEMAAILACRDRGIVYFFSMAVSFTKAALGAEGVGKDIDMFIGNGYARHHAEISLNVLRESPKLKKLFEELYGG